MWKNLTSVHLLCLLQILLFVTFLCCYQSVSFYCCVHFPLVYFIVKECVESVNDKLQPFWTSWIVIIWGAIKKLICNWLIHTNWLSQQHSDTQYPFTLLHANPQTVLFISVWVVVDEPSSLSLPLPLSVKNTVMSDKTSYLLLGTSGTVPRTAGKSLMTRLSFNGKAGAKPCSWCHACTGPFLKWSGLANSHADQ